MVNCDLIKDIQGTHIAHSRKYFYLWLVCKFGYSRSFTYEECYQYGVKRRQILRYFKDLVSVGMVYKERGGYGTKTRLSLEKELF